MSALILATIGCKSFSVTRYVSPEVTGRALDADTRQPIRGVKVKRVAAKDNSRSMEAPKGGEILNEPSPVVTGADGRFVLDSARNLAVFGRLGWTSVNLALQHPAYRPLAVSFTLANATNTAKGEPLVDAGDLLLIPRAR